MGDNNPVLYGKVQISGYVNYNRQDEVLVIYKSDETCELLNCIVTVDNLRLQPWPNNGGIPLSGTIPKVLITNSKEVFKQHERFGIKVWVCFNNDFFRLIKQAKDNNIDSDVRGETKIIYKI